MTDATELDEAVARIEAALARHRAAVEALRDEWNRRYDANDHMTGCPPGAGYYDLLALEIDDVLRGLDGGAQEGSEQ